ncbi:hypothetical protein FQA47_010666 [Oryzias melastigma]|uniref:Apolipoprotein M n=1 Tax=Oryzias melastigma TaxID=30732 RepID=A0A834C0E7_ORYME|nr:hypothetical protein FQA47_010666 [Oryzias melastigma]
MLPLYAVALLCWASVSRSAPTPCEDLARPLDQVEFPDLKGSWVLVLASASDPSHVEKLKSRDSATISFDNYTDSSEMALKRVYSSSDGCEYMQSNITVEGSGFSFAEHNISVSFLRSSCADCITMLFNKSSHGPVRLYLFSRRREVSPQEGEGSIRFGDECQHRLYNISAEGRAFTFDVGNRFQLTGALLQTSCPDCLVMRWVVSSKRRHSVDLYLLSRRRTVEPKEMEEFRAQLKCYQLPVPVVMDPFQGSLSRAAREPINSSNTSGPGGEQRSMKDPDIAPSITPSARL